jgi:hypothetical protein
MFSTNGEKTSKPTLTLWELAQRYVHLREDEGEGVFVCVEGGGG